MSSPSDATQPHHRPGRSRELYIDAFRGLMALVMVQGHVFDFLLSPELRAEPLYQFQVIFHGSTAPGFLFASGFVAGLPRAPLSLSASLRRARRLLFVLAVGYVLHLPYFSFWKTLLATPAEQAALFVCDALQAIAVTQLAVLLLQWPFGRRWPAAAGGLAVLVLAAGPSSGPRGCRSACRPGWGPTSTTAAARTSRSFRSRPSCWPAPWPAPRWGASSRACGAAAPWPGASA